MFFQTLQSQFQPGYELGRKDLDVTFSLCLFWRLSMSRALAWAATEGLGDKQPGSAFTLINKLSNPSFYHYRSVSRPEKALCSRAWWGRRMRLSQWRAGTSLVTLWRMFLWAPTLWRQVPVGGTGSTLWARYSQRLIQTIFSLKYFKLNFDVNDLVFMNYYRVTQQLTLQSGMEESWITTLCQMARMTSKMRRFLWMRILVTARHVFNLNQSLGILPKNHL